MAEKENLISKGYNDSLKSGDKLRLNENNKTKYYLKIIIPIIIGILSFVLLANKFSDVSFHQNTINNLNKKQETVLQLSAASTSLAVGASFVLGDRATPISNKLLALSGYFLLILSVIMLEKYLVTVLGFISFKIIIPVSCMLFSLFIIIDIKKVRRMAINLFLFALISFFVIPISVEISNNIEKTYKISIEQTLSENAEIRDNIDNSNIGQLEKENKDTNNTDNNQSVFDWFKSIGEKATEVVGNAMTTVSGEATKLINKLTSQFNRMIEFIAVMIVTTCIIPLMVIIFLFWLMRTLFNISISINFENVFNKYIKGNYGRA